MDRKLCFNLGMDERTATTKAIDAVGVRRVANHFGISVQAVYQWRQDGRVPADRVLCLSNLSGVSPHHLRPDVFGVKEAA